MAKRIWMFFIVVLFIVQFVDFGDAIKWLSLQHSHIHWNVTNAATSNNPGGRGIRSGGRSPCSVARRRHGLARPQARLCRSAPDAMPHVQQAAVVAAETCKIAFRNRRWNCSSVTSAPFLTPDLTRATREQAYVYAISSAALTYTLARACAAGALHQCTCAAKPSTPPAKHFQWGGCGDNIQWGAQFAKKFIDNVEKYTLEKTRSKTKRHDNINEAEPNESNVGMKYEMAMVNLHNNRVGRKVMAESLHTQCKCHGVSGSCNIKTCWRALPSMTEIGQRLLKKYTNALEVSKDILDKSMTEESKKSKTKPASSQALIYISKSPDYCTKDDNLGSFGTVGRQCNVTSGGPESCRQLCCGRGYRTVVDEKIERCHCKFYNCCYVKCKICRTMTQVYECL